MAAARIFISYVYSNSETFASNLRQRLEREYPKLTLWQNRANVGNHVGGWSQSERALQEAEFMVLVATPTAMASPIVKKEWRYARQQGVCICPVQNPDQPIDLANLPGWICDAHFYDLDREWEAFIDQLHSQCHQARVPFMAPDLTDRFVERPREFYQLLTRLLDANRKNPVAITTALRGAGGFGKTTLAAALCHHDDVLTAFDDGILWVSLGERPSLVDQLIELLIALTGQRPTQTTEDRLATVLVEKLANKNCLIVIDDVWDSAHLRPFLQGGERCARLITTRNAKIAADASAHPIHVDEMTSSESVQMLISGINLKLDDVNPFTALAHRLGEWPLMLELANAFLRERLVMGDSLTVALAFLNQTLNDKGIEAINTEDGDERKQGALGTLAASLRMLDDQERQRLIELSIFPEDTDIPLSTIGQLWGINAVQTRRLCQRLAELSFFRFMPQAGTIRFHDVMRESLQAQVTDAAALHQRLLTAWGDNVYELPADNAYAWRWIAYHLHGAGRDEDLKVLFGDPEWMHTRFEHDNYTYTGYLRDVIFAWESIAQPQALAQIETHDEPIALVDCLRYALIYTSINSLAGNYVPEIVAHAVDAGIWTTQRALGIARQVPDPEERAWMYTQLLATGKFEEDQVREAKKQALAAAQAIQDEADRAKALAALADQFEGETRQQIVQHALDAARAIRRMGSRSWALAKLVDQFEGETRQQIVQHALDAALAIQDEGTRSRALACLADQFEGETRQQIVQHALDAALAIQDEGPRSRALVELADLLAGDQLQQVLAVALAIQHEWDRAEVLAKLADQFEGETRQQIVQHALEAALALLPLEYRAEALAELANQIEGETHQQIVQHALDAALMLQHEWDQTSVLLKLSDWLVGDQVQHALAAALAFQDVDCRASVLAELSDRLEGETRQQIVQQALEAALAIKDELDRSNELARFIDRLEEDQVQQVLEAALMFQDEEPRADTLVRLVDRLEGDQVQQALDAALAIQHGWEQSRVLVSLADRLTEDQVQQALAAARAIHDEEYRSGALARLSDQLEGKTRQHIVQQALNAALAILPDLDRSGALARLADQLEGDQVQQALDAALAIQHEDYRVWALAELANRFEGEKRQQIVQQALDAALEIQHELQQASALEELADRLSGDQVQQALDAALAIQHEDYRALALAGLIIGPKGESRQQIVQLALEAALAFQHKGPRLQALARLAGWLEAEPRQQIVQQALDAALASEYEWDRADLLVRVADQLEGDQVHRALEIALAIQHEWDQSQVLVKLANQLEGDQVQRALEAALALQDERYRADVLVCLASQLAGQQVQVALEAALAIQHEEHRARALTVFLPISPHDSSLVAHIRQSIADFLMSHRDQKRKTVLSFLSTENLFAPPIFSQDTLAHMADHITEICHEWTWL